MIDQPLLNNTDTGDIPIGWKIMRLGDVCQLRKEIIMPSNGGKTKYVGLEHIDTGNIMINRWGSDHDVQSAKSRFFKGDILYGKLRPYLDKVAIAEWNGICSTDILVFDSIKEKIIPKYLVYLLHMKEFLTYAIGTMSGVNHPRTSWADIKQFTYGIPPLSEQSAIAYVLSCIQKAIEVQDRIIAVTKELKKALMQKLFMEGLHGEDLKETEIGKIPSSWRIERFGNYAIFKNGINFNNEMKGNGVLTIDVLNMYSDMDHILLDNLYRVNKQLKEEYLLKNNDLLFVRSSLKEAGVGWASLFFGYDEPVTYCGFIIRARMINNELNPKFLLNYFRLESVRKKLVSKSGKVAITNINQGNLSSILIPIPHIAEQHQIADILEKFDNRILCFQKRYYVLNSLFKSMLNLLMTGKVRVKDMEVSANDSI